ncbi:MAG: hypothetical protein D6797_00645, partial [Bdellovibrio sp.]
MCQDRYKTKAMKIKNLKSQAQKKIKTLSKELKGELLDQKILKLTSKRYQEIKKKIAQQRKLLEGKEGSLAFQVGERVLETVREVQKKMNKASRKSASLE